MGESLTQRCRVQDEAPRGVNCFQGLESFDCSIPEEVTANFVPAAAVIRRWQALFEITGLKGRVGGHDSAL